jgi:two-component SAPR family response regulator
MLSKALVLFLLLILPCRFITGQDIQYGLRFKSYEVEKESRTGLNLTPEKPFTFKNGFTLSFCVNFHADWIHPFGSVMRIFTDERQHLDLILSEIENTGKVMISLVSSSHDIFFSKPFDREINYGLFIPVKISIDILHNRIEARIGAEEFSTQNAALSCFNRVHILFGKSAYPQFQTTDVPSFTLKDLRIDTSRGEPLYSWPLSRYTQQGVYDDLRRHFAASENAEWLQDRHAVWERKAWLETGINPQFCYNPDKNEVAIVDGNRLLRYHILTGTVSADTFRNKLAYELSNANNLVYNPVTREYNCPFLELDEGIDMLRYDSLSRDWDKGLRSVFPPDYWQHNRFFSPADSCLYLFFGYGHHRYKNEINRYDYQKKAWEKVSFKNDRIPPRYLSGLGRLDDQRLILFGGYGNETGNQSLSPQYFYDLYLINIRTLEARKLWEIENPQDEFVVSNSVIVDKERRFFYALAFPLQQFHTKLTLLKFSLDQPGYSVVSDSIPFQFEDIRSNVDLYLDKSSNQFIAVVVSPQSNARSVLSVYALSYPPLRIESLRQQEAASGLFSRLHTGAWAASALLAALASGGLLFFFRRKKKQKRAAERLQSRHETAEWFLPCEAPRKSSVNLFGGFQVFDKAGSDVTGEFSPTLKRLFVALFLYTVKNGKGISAVKLKDIFWYDKSDESAKNNRGVFVNKLRQAFEQIGPLYIKNQDLYWSLELGETVYCDYTQVQRLTEQLEKAPESAGINAVRQLLSIVSKGELLPNMQTEWMDTFKSDFSNRLIDLLLELYRHSAVFKTPAICIRLADCIFIHDPLNEDALAIKCFNLVQMGKYGLAQKVYLSFSKEYHALFDSKFKCSFEQLINR